jgi:hypothetical protein
MSEVGNKKSALSGRPYKFGEPLIHRTLRIPKSIDLLVSKRALANASSYSEALVSTLINIKEYI